LVNPEPSPTNVVAVTVPTILVEPITCSAYPFAVVPIPTPLPSTAKIEEPEPIWKVLSPGDMVAIPTLSKIATFASCSKTYTTKTIPIIISV
jgi:hypothetical protein